MLSKIFSLTYIFDLGLYRYNIVPLIQSDPPYFSLTWCIWHYPYLLENRFWCPPGPSMILSVQRFEHYCIFTTHLITSEYYLQTNLHTQLFSHRTHSSTGEAKKRTLVTAYLLRLIIAIYVYPFLLSLYCITIACKRSVSFIVTECVRSLCYIVTERARVCVWDREGEQWLFLRISLWVCLGVCVCVSEWGFSFFPAALPCSAQPSSFSLFSSNSALFAPQKIFVIQPLCLVTNKTLSCTCRFHNSTFISQATKKTENKNNKNEKK